jgi:nicotinate-nucleotide adenylyltransferase
MRIAFFGGSFDPPHQGHLAVARAAQQSLHLDQVLFAPVALQPLKPGGPSASFLHRAAMTGLAIAGQPDFQLSLLDAPGNSADTPNYTSETLLRLRQSLPPGAQLYLLLGADSFRTLPQWHHAAEIPFLANLIVASRPGFESESLSSLFDLSSSLPPGIEIHPSLSQSNQYLLTGSGDRQSSLTLLPDLHYDISATQLRLQIQGDPSNHLIPEAVLQYIHRNHLYE